MWHTERLMRFSVSEASNATRKALCVRERGDRFGSGAGIERVRVAARDGDMTAKRIPIG